jgi:hypothetical protein
VVAGISARLRGNLSWRARALMLGGTAERNLRGRSAMYEVAQVQKEVQWPGKGGELTRVTGDVG